MKNDLWSNKYNRHVRKLWKKWWLPENLDNYREDKYVIRALILVWHVFYVFYRVTEYSTSPMFWRPSYVIQLTGS